MILGEDELKQEKIKIKEMGLPEGHPEKDGVLVDLSQLVPEVQKRLRAKADEEGVSNGVEGLSVGEKVGSTTTGNDGV